MRAIDAWSVAGTRRAWRPGRRHGRRPRGRRSPRGTSAPAGPRTLRMKASGPSVTTQMIVRWSRASAAHGSRSGSPRSPQRGEIGRREGHGGSVAHPRRARRWRHRCAEVAGPGADEGPGRASMHRRRAAVRGVASARAALDPVHGPHRRGRPERFRRPGRHRSPSRRGRGRAGGERRGGDGPGGRRARRVHADWHPAAHAALRPGRRDLAGPLRRRHVGRGASTRTSLVDGPVVRKGTAGEDGYSGFTMRDPATGDDHADRARALLRARGHRAGRRVRAGHRLLRQGHRARRGRARLRARPSSRTRSRAVDLAAGRRRSGRSTR